jgi:arylsulfatase A-like enzyme
MNMKRPSALIFLFTILWTCSIFGADRPPNFIVIFADDLGYGDLGCYGHPAIATPHLDRMADEGQRWTDFYAAAPICSPSRAGLLTGRYPVKTGTAPGVFFEWSAEGLDPAEITIAETLREQGYVTAAIGKWHLGHKPPYLPTSQGFDSYYGIPYSNDMRMDCRMPFADNAKFREGMTLEKAQTTGNKKQNWVPLMENDKVVEYPCDQDSLTRRCTERCIAFIRENRDRPFFLYYASSFPHIPLHVSDAFRGKSQRGLYGDVVEELDASVGRILETLREMGLDRKTLVVFTSDNGPWLSQKEQGGSAGLLYGGKGMTWEGGMREPAIFWWPGSIAAGSTCRQIGSTLDLHATFAALAGAEARPEDSLDLTPALKGGSSPRDTFFYYRNEELYAVRSGPWKLHVATQGAYRMFGDKVIHDPPLLYHLGHDPGEFHDVAGRHPEIVRELSRLIEKQSAEVTPGRNRYTKKLEYQERPDWSK